MTDPVSVKTGVLFAVPGTSDPAAAAAYANIERAVARRFPAAARGWGYTSAGVRRKVAAQGCHLDDPQEAMSRLREQGVTRLAVLPLHLSDGMEYSELREMTEEAGRGAGGFERIALGVPLLVSGDDCRRALAAVMAETAAAGRADAAAILVAHGSRQAAETFQKAATLFREVDRNLFLGAILCPPQADEVIAACRESGVRKAWLLPCMVVAGFSAKEDIAGAGAGTWKSMLERGGIECVPFIKGLGEFEGVVGVWAEQVGRLLGQLES